MLAVRVKDLWPVHAKFAEQAVIAEHGLEPARLKRLFGVQPGRGGQLFGDEAVFIGRNVAIPEQSPDHREHRGVRKRRQ